MLGAQGTFDNSANNFTANNFNSNVNTSQKSKSNAKEEESKQSSELAEKLAKFDEIQKAMEENLNNISKYEEYLKQMKEEQEKGAANVNNGMISLQQRPLNQFFNENNDNNQLSSSQDIVHITASQAPTNPNTSQVFF